MSSEIICIGLGFGAGVTVAVLHQVKTFNNLHKEIDRLRKEVAKRNLAKLILEPVFAEGVKEIVKAFFPIGEKGDVIKNEPSENRKTTGERKITKQDP